MTEEKQDDTDTNTNTNTNTSQDIQHVIACLVIFLAGVYMAMNGWERFGPSLMVIAILVYF